MRKMLPLAAGVGTLLKPRATGVADVSGSAAALASEDCLRGDKWIV